MSVRRTRFAARRKSMGLSQEGLAEAVGVDRSTVVRWEAGETEPQPWARPRLARVLAVSAEELAGLLAAVGVARHEDSDRLRFALEHPDGADVVTVAALRREVDELDEQYVRVPSVTLLAPAGQCLGHVRFLGAHATKSRV